MCVCVYNCVRVCVCVCVCVCVFVYSRDLARLLNDIQQEVIDRINQEKAQAARARALTGVLLRVANVLLCVANLLLCGANVPSLTQTP